MVNSVLEVSKTRELRREDNRTSDNGYGRQNSNRLFAEVLKKAVEEVESNQVECHTTTYGPDSRLTTFEYMKREYHY